MTKPTTHPVAWAKSVRGITHTEKLVLLILADYTNGAAGCAWPSVQTIADDACLSARAVRYALRGLESHGLLTTTVVKLEERRNAPNRYRLNVGAGTVATVVVTAPAAVEAPATPAEVVESAPAKLGIKDVAAAITGEGGILDELLAGADSATEGYLAALDAASELAAENPQLSKDPAGYLRNAVVGRAAYDLHSIDAPRAARLFREAKVLGRDGHRWIIVALASTASAPIAGDPVSYTISAARRLAADAKVGVR